MSSSASVNTLSLHLNHLEPPQRWDTDSEMANTMIRQTTSLLAANMVNR